MKSKTSFCNKVIFCKDITRFWPLWALEWAMYIFLGVLPLVSQISVILEQKGGVLELTNAYLSGGTFLYSLPFTLALWSIAVALNLFSYLTKEREAYTIHSFPMKRSTLFVSHYLAGLVILAVPMLSTGAVTFLIGTANKIPVAGLIWIYMAQGSVQMIFFYSLACMVIMLTGNGGMSFVIYSVLNFLAVGVIGLYSMLSGIFVYGSRVLYDMADLLQGDVIRVLTPVYMFFQHSGASGLFNYDGSSRELLREAIQQGTQDLGLLSLYLIPAAVLVVLAVFLYAKRPLESAGDMVAFSWGKPIFRVVFTFCASLLFSAFLYALLFGEVVGPYAYAANYRIVLMLVLFSTVLFYLIGNMILDKTFFIWKTTSYVRMGVLVAVMALGMLLVRSQGLGAQIPDQEDVKAASIRLEKASDLDEDFYYYAPPYLLLYDTDRCGEVWKLNREILQYGKDLNLNEQYPDMDFIYIRYELKNGGSFYADYPVEPGCALSQKTEGIFRDQTDLCAAVFSPDYQKGSPDHVRVEWLDEDGETHDKILDRDNDVPVGRQRKRDRIYQAVLKDIQAGNMDVYRLSSTDKVLYMLDVGIDKVPAWASDDNAYLPVTKECTETLKVLKDLKDCGVPDVRQDQSVKKKLKQ